MLFYRVCNTFVFCSTRLVEHFRWNLTGSPRRLEDSSAKTNVDYGGTAHLKRFQRREVLATAVGDILEQSMPEFFLSLKNHKWFWTNIIGREYFKTS